MGKSTASEDRARDEGASSAGIGHRREEPGRLWIAHEPVAWPSPEQPWTNWAHRTLGGSGVGALPTVDSSSVAGLLYVPPIEQDLAREREAWIEGLAAEGVSLLVQRSPGDGAASGTGALDLLPWLLSGELRELETTCEVAVWPLVAGISDDPALWETGLATLAGVGVTSVVPVTLELDAKQRRILAGYTGEDGYQALFHGPTPDERALARRATSHGFGVFARYPNFRGSARHRFARLAACELTHTGVLWLRVGRSEVGGQEMLRAARFCKGSPHDLEALAREGNLDIVPWLTTDARQVIEHLAAGCPSELRLRLEEEYLAEP